MPQAAPGGYSSPQCGPLLGFYGPGQGFQELFGEFGGCLLLESFQREKLRFGVSFPRSPTVPTA